MSHIDEGVLEAYLDGETEEEERRELEQHLETCIECRERLVEVTTLSRSVSALLAELEPGPVQPPPWHELEERAAERMTAPQRRSWVRPGLAWAASLFLVFSIGWWSGSVWKSELGRAHEMADRAEAPAARLDGVEKKEDRARLAEEPPASALGAPARDKSLAFQEQLGKDGEDEAPALVGQSKPEPAAKARAEGAAGVAAETELDDRDRSRADAARVQGAADQTFASEERSRQFAELEPGAEGAELRSQLEEARPETAAPQRLEMPGVQSRPAPEPAPAAADFRISMATDPDDAASRIGGELRTLPDLELQRVEVVPGSGVEGGLDHLPAVRMTYLDAAGHEIVLVQQLISTGDRAAMPAEPKLVVEPSGLRSYRWRDSEGYLLILRGEVSSDSLRALADLVR